MAKKRALGLFLLIIALSFIATPSRTPKLAQENARTAEVGSPGPAAAVLFLIGASPASLTIVQGYWGWSTINVYTLPGQAGDVNLTVSAPVGLSATLNPRTVSLPPSPATVILTITAGGHATPGTYLVVVDGTSDTSSHSVGVSVTILPSASPSFEISSSPPSLTIPAGTNGTSTITVNSINGFTGDVRLAATVSPTGPSASFTPTDITLASDRTAYSTMKIYATSLLPSGNYAITIQGSNGTISDSWVVEVFVGIVPLDFEMSSSPPSLTIPAGTNGTSTITVNSINGFTGDVRLAATVSPTGPSASFTPTDITLASAGPSGTSVLRVETTSSTAPGTYIIKTSGTGNSISHYVVFSLVVIPGAPPAVGMSASPSSLALQAGASGSSVITLTSLNGFSGDVTLSLVGVVPNQNPPSISFSPASISLASGQTASSSLIVSTTASTPGGAYNVLVQGSSGMVSETWAIEVFVSVTSLDFSLSLTPAIFSVPDGSSAKYLITLTSLNSFSGTVSLSTCQSCISPIVPARPMMTVSPTDVALGPGGTATSNLTLFTNSTTPPGTYNIVLNAQSGALYHLVGAYLTVTQPPDFSLAPGSTSVTFTAGSAGNDTLIASGENSFSGTISFAASSTPSTGLTVSCPSVTLNSTTAIVTSNCALQSSSAGSYSVDFIGSGGTPLLTHQARILVSVNKASPALTTLLSAANVTIGGSANDSATLAGAAGSAGGNVAYNLFSGGTCAGTPSVVSDVTVSNGVIPNSSSRRFNSTGTFSWNAVYSGDSNNNPATSSCEFFAVTSAPPSKGFVIFASVSSLIVEQGDAGRLRITLQSIGFAGKVNLTVTLSSALEDGIRARLRTPSLMLRLNDSRSALLTIWVEEDAPIGNFSITVTGSSDSLSHSATVKVIVTAPAPSREVECAGERYSTQLLDTPVFGTANLYLTK